MTSPDGASSSLTKVANAIQLAFVTLLRGAATMELKDLRYFSAVVQSGGFRRAADYLEVQQSVLSRRIRSLEDGIGVSLLERHWGGVRLTNAGRVFARDIELLLEALEVTIAHAMRAGEGANGFLKIGLGASLFGGPFRDLLLAWREREPAVELTFVEASPRELLRELQERTLDVAVVAGTEWARGCETEVIFREQVYAVLPRNAAADLPSPLEPDAIGDWPFKVCRSGFGPQIRDWIFRRISNLSQSPKVELVDVSRGVLMSMVSLGLGVTFATHAETNAIYPDIVYLPVRDETIDYSALWLSRNDNPALRRFLSLARIYAARAQGCAMR